MTKYPPTKINRPKKSSGSNSVKTFIAYFACFVCTWIALVPPVISIGILWLLATWRAYTFLDEQGKSKSGLIVTGVAVIFALISYL